jgi:hypothetical protein
MADKSLVQLQAITTIEDTDIYHVFRGNIDYKITAANFVKGIKPYYEFTALISNAAPFNITSGTLMQGANYTITTFVTGDDFSNMELVSGTMNTTGAVIKAISTTPTTYSNGSTLHYSGEPFVSSLDQGNSPNSFVYTFPYSYSFTYNSPGYFTLNLTHDSIKLFYGIGAGFNGNLETIYSDFNGATLSIRTSSSNGDGTFTPDDGILYYTPLTIKGYL